MCRVVPCCNMPKYAQARLLWMLFAVLGWASMTSGGQTFELPNHGLRVISLDGQWRFHPGDNPAWSSPSFQDADWALQSSSHVWDSKTFHDPSGLGWYRFHVTLPPNTGSITINLPHILTCYQVFANGQLIGSYGQMPPNAIPTSGGFNMLYTLPPAMDNASEITFAIRVWQWPALGRFYGGGPLYGGATVGESQRVRYLDEQLRNSRHWIFNSTLILALLQTLAALGSLALFLLRPPEREYLWFCLVLLSSAAVSWLALSFYFSAWPLVLHNQIEAMLLGPSLNLAEIAFYFFLLKGRRTPLFWIAIVSSLVSIPYSILFGTIVGDSVSAYLGQDLLMLPVSIWILALLFSRTRQNFLDARLLFAPVLLQKACMLFQQGAILTSTLGWQHVVEFRIRLTDEPFRIELMQMVDALFLLMMLTILILRFTRTRSHEERYASELEGARSVQQFLIPTDMPHIPGLAIESVYLPAREVGGDFFQILPDASDNSTLIVLGDVAGKGLEAGMLATLVVGAVRTAASFTRDPAVILFTLNNRLCGRGNATCLALSIAADGAAMLVNAGHLPPYLNHEEMSIEGALPLGILPEMTYQATHFQLSEGDTLMLMSDGVAEAQQPDGELFGFARVGEMLSKNATVASLADAAQSFGQTDDITVLALSRVATHISVEAVL
jgi:sigma-B regulation protein RsbU (phosphoserine phosphatase)